jgi:glycosyltransferase involved in cell wall biosynthesis
MTDTKPAIWFPTVRTNTGTDVFTERLVEGLRKRGIRAEITWLPLRAEYLPWTIAIPKPPKWATLVHVNTWLHHRFLPKSLPVVATLHHSVHDPKLRPYKGLLRALYHQYWIAPNERRVMRQAARVTAVSQFVADMAKKTLCDVPTQVIYNGIDTDKFKPDPNVKKPHQPFRLLYVGSWITRKGVDLLAPIMRELGDGFVLHYTGGEAAEKDKATMPPNMVDIGRLTSDEVIIAMQNADAFLFPTRSEGLPLVAIEAMACGLPVIAMKGTAVDEVVEHGVTGYLCPSLHTQDWFQFINKMKKILIQQQKSSRARACILFNYNTMLENYSKCYTDLVNQKIKLNVIR